MYIIIFNYCHIVQKYCFYYVICKPLLFLSLAFYLNLPYFIPVYTSLFMIAFLCLYIWLFYSWISAISYLNNNIGINFNTKSPHRLLHLQGLSVYLFIFCLFGYYLYWLLSFNGYIIFIFNLLCFLFRNL